MSLTVSVIKILLVFLILSTFISLKIHTAGKYVLVELHKTEEERKRPFWEKNDITTQKRRQVSKDSNFYGNEHGEDYLDAELGNKTLSNSDRNETSGNITKRFRAAGGRSILEFNCKVTFDGGCKEHLKLKIKELHDQPYSVTKCFKTCESTENCGGFSIGLQDNSCHLYVDGCTRNDDGQFTYFSMNACKADNWCAKVYEKIDYSGWEVIIPEKTKGSFYGTDKDNEVSSLKIHSGCTLKVYDGYRLDELSFTYTKDEAQLSMNSGQNDFLTSFSCSCGPQGTNAGNQEDHNGKTTENVAVQQTWTTAFTTGMEQEHSSPHVTTVKSENSVEPHAYYDSPDDTSNSANNSDEPHAYYDSPDDDSNSANNSSEPHAFYDSSNEASTDEDISFEGHAYYD